MPILVDFDTILSKQKISLRELSHQTGISTTDLKTLKLIQIHDPRLLLLKQICDALHCDLSEILKSDIE